jgi:hypothetical protein
VSEAHEHLEHAEHAEHAAHAGGFDRKVAVTVAIIAAVLAGVALLGHRKHNDTLIHKTIKGQLEVKESNTWAQYQSKRLRQQMDILQIQTLTRLPGAKDPDPDVAKLKDEVARYKTELDDLKKQGEGVQAEVKKADAAAEHAHHQANWLDLSHLAVELGLVICSLAILTKRKQFWFAGIAVTVLGIASVGYALAMPEHHEESPGHVEEGKEAKPGGGH